MDSVKSPNLKSRFLDFYQKHEVLVSVGVFFLGFAFDLLTLGRIDDLLNLVQQAVYLLILGALLILEIKVKIGAKVLSPRMNTFWQYHDLVVHFLFGSLLSAYTIFYYTSASALTSFFFILLLAGLMMANEFPQIQKLGLPVRVILYTICMLSYFAFFYPILLGHVGFVPFWLGLISSLLVFGLVWKVNFKDVLDHQLLRKHVLYPSVALHLFFLVGYYTSLIPPVPVAVKKIGIYYDVLKENGKYLGKHQRPSWKFWQTGSQDFYVRAGDKVFVMLSIFSPARFEDKVYLRWYFDDPKKGWFLEDSIPLNILGGRDEGFRGFGSKQFYRLGDWRVLVETSDGREVGRISLEVKTDNSTDERIFKIDDF
ncbi:MAG TPA: DUF2914 domain-containing protein [Bacteriovoracaceae bacterium]|nr:DUF2914 domain-containing protein [Bacteriovoracaceae bacterium]